MLWHLTKSVALAALLAWGVQHLTGSDVLAGSAALVLLMLRVANLVPFATVALPIAVAALIGAQGVTGSSPVLRAVSLVQTQLQTVGVALAAETGQR